MPTSKINRPEGMIPSPQKRVRVRDRSKADPHFTAVQQVQEQVLSSLSWVECMEWRKRTKTPNSRRSTDRLYREDDPEFFDALQALAEKSNKPQTDIAAELGLDRHELSKMIQGKIGVKFAGMKRLTSALGVTIHSKDLRYSVLLQVGRHHEGPVNHGVWNQLRHSLSYIVETLHPMEVDQFQALAQNQGLQKFIVGTSVTTTYEALAHLAQKLEYGSPAEMMNQYPGWDRNINIGPDAPLWRERFRVRYSHGL